MRILKMALGPVVIERLGLDPQVGDVILRMSDHFHTPETTLSIWRPINPTIEHPFPAIVDIQKISLKVDDGDMEVTLLSDGNKLYCYDKGAVWELSEKKR